jgi:hypothetical protein
MIPRRDFNLLKSGEVYLKSNADIKQDLKKILRGDCKPCCGFDYIESLNPNPVSIPTLANLICGIKGDILCRILNLKPTYYVNDVGSNFSKFLLNHRFNRTHPIDSVYNLLVGTEQDLLGIRKQVFECYPADAIVLRDAIVEKILNEYKQLDTLTPDLIYESTYTALVKQAINASQIREKGLYYRDVQIATSTKVPLYIAADYFYHLDIDRLYSNKLQLVSKDHSKYIKTIDTMTGVPWNYNLCPMVHYQGDKLSKRKGHNLTLEELIEAAPRLSRRQVITCLKLFFMKYENRDKLDLEQLLIECKTPYLLKPLKVATLLPLDQVEVLIDELTEEQIDQVLRVWANLVEVFHWSVERLDLNKIYKFIEHVYGLPKTSKSKLIHDRLMHDLLKLLGL